MSITPSFLKKLFSVFVIAIFSVSLLFVAFTSIQPKEAKALDINKCLTVDANARNYPSFNYGYRSNYYNRGCNIINNSIQCLICNCNNGVDCSSNVYPDSSNLYCQSNGAYYIDINSYNNSCIIYPNYAINYSYNNYNSCVNCFEQAVTQLQNGVNNYNLGNASVDPVLLNNITNSGLAYIPTSVVSYVSGNTAYTEVKNYSGTVLASTSFSINEQGITTVNNSNFSSITPNCLRNLNLYVCKSFSTIQLANQFGSSASISVPFESTFTITPTQNYNNYYNPVAYNTPIYNDYYYYYSLEDCNNSLFGCGY